MHIREIVYAPHFQRAFKKLSPEWKETINERVSIFKKDCFDHRLKTHKLKGKLNNYWSFSLTDSHRVLFCFEGNGRVGFVDVGDHSIYQ